MAFFKMPGIKVPHRKNTRDMEPKRIKTPEEVCIPMSMHIGAPNTPLVKIGDKVKKGQLIGRAEAKITAPVHASVSGTVKGFASLPSVTNSEIRGIVIASDGLDEIYEGITPPVITDKQSFIQAVEDSGLVGLGGAAFPTAVKLRGEPETVIINGAECEPYITSDTHTMVAKSDDIVGGIGLIQQYIRPKNIIIAIEDNKKEAIQKLKQVFDGVKGVEVRSLPSVYPQGGEKVLIYSVTKKIVPEGKLPGDIGILVLNVTTVAFMAHYARTGMPITEKCITVDGNAVKNRGNYVAPIGTRIKDLIEAAGGFSCPPEKILLGGPMMGVAVPTTEYPVMKGTNAVLVFDKKEAAIPTETPCINCGSCIQNCPLRLDPPGFGKAYAKKDCATLEALKVNLCMECGVCAYVCPAKRHLVQRNRLAKRMLREYKETIKNG